MTGHDLYMYVCDQVFRTRSCLTRGWVWGKPGVVYGEERIQCGVIGEHYVYLTESSSNHPDKLDAGWMKGWSTVRSTVVTACNI